MHGVAKTGKEAVDVRVSSIVDNDIGMTILCEANNIRQARSIKVILSYPTVRTSDLATSDILGVNSPGKFLAR